VLKSTSLHHSEVQQAPRQVIDNLGVEWSKSRANICVAVAVRGSFPIDSSTTSASRMHVAFRALSISRLFRASQSLSTNELRGQHGLLGAHWRSTHRQLYIIRNSRPTKRSDLRESYRGFSSIAQSPDTIYALSTAAGRAAIAVIRISGPACLDVRFPFRQPPMLANA
jgi:hypothetical protein